MNKYPAETNELIPVYVRLRSDDSLVLAGVEFAILPVGVRSPVWLPAVNVNGTLHVRLAGKSPDTYRVWVRVTLGTETAVDFAGDFAII